MKEKLPVILFGPLTDTNTTSILAEINSTYPGYAKAGSVVVRTEEALIVTLVLLLWVAAIALFFNRWGKIRMLEPYQPKFEREHRSSCAIIDTNTLPLRTCSKFNIHCVDHSLCVSPNINNNRLRQNSVFGDSSMTLLPGYNSRYPPRRSKSAFDLQSIGETNGQINNSSPAQCLSKDKKLEEEEDDEDCELNNDASLTINNLQKSLNPIKSFQRERGMSICQFDNKNDVHQQLVRPLQRERGMSICHFDRMDVLAHPILPRERGMSICHFDRMDVLARPLPSSSFIRGSRASIFNSSIDKNDINLRNQYQRIGSRSSIGNIEVSNKFIQHRIKDTLGESLGNKNLTTVNTTITGHRNNHQQNFHSNFNDGPSCSKSSDHVLGYNATCL
ncbi:hypothetical protein HCN44_004022 [Aphidius gifuensis]|uniref:Fibronectin type III domain-containing protein n=1 Tax=Aphidius gifuensis TaxID=684658 RepID=A0A835CVM8_APHGI|nr:uncharacterized protein LOC122848269 [Aphidius gifuensis]XP_044002172.1 uncharacterized protein LOC122848269 [Aphidius gifuensis]KAF7994550.1 hypothetical protein HCN44_004022 [Aphidius gifuensis]